MARDGNGNATATTAATSADETTLLLAGNGSSRNNATHQGHDTQQDEERSIASSPSTASKTTSADGVSPLTIVSILTIGVFIAQLDTSFVLATHTKIASDFGQLANSSWVVAAYTLAMCAVQPCYGKMSDVFGRKRSLLVGYILFGVGSVISGIAASIGGVIAGRAIAGIGGAGVSALVSLIILDLVPLREVAKLRSYVNVAATTGRSLGGPIGGALADSIGWRWSFILQCPLLLASGLLAMWIVPVHLPSDDEISDNDETRSQSVLRRIDFAGAGALATSITTLMLALEFAGRKYDWTDPLILILLAVSLVFSILFVIIETYWAAEPIFPLHLLQNRNVITAYVIAGFQLAAQFSLMFCVPLYFEVTKNASSAQAGAHLFPAVAGNTCGALLAGIIIERNGRYKILSIIATISAAFCYTLLIIRWQGDTGLLESLYIMPGGFGTGMVEASVFISISASIDRSLQAIALSGLFQSQNVGSLVGLAISSSVLQSTLEGRLESSLAKYPDKAEIIANAIANIEHVMRLRGGLHDIIVASYVKALENTHAVSLACSIVALLAALATKQHAIS